MLKLYNTPTKQSQPLKPLHDNEVSLYTCGPTVYSEPTIGNWVAYIRWDLLVRTLKAEGYIVRRVMNITDVGHLVSDADEGEDKMEQGARREGATAWEIADRYTNRFLEGMTALNLMPPEQLARATDHIAEQIKLIETLEQKGHTYIIDDGVYFDTTTFDKYADFAGLDLDQLRAGARVQTSSQKRNPADFALWKFSPSDATRDMEWQSPWGKGFPGWHIECSAMALTYLGETIDIHTGGIDHIPVHHTNEIAQSESATGRPLANIWLHANFLLVNGTKISKSLSNGYSLDDLREKGYSALDFKLFVLQSQYRSESNFTFDNLAAAAARYKRWLSVAALRHQALSTPPESSTGTTYSQTKNEILAALDDDLNSPLALTAIDKAFDEVEKSGLYQGAIDEFIELLQFIDDILGVEILTNSPDINDELKDLIQRRESVRQDKDWALSDKLRDQIAESGIGVRDTSAGSYWYYL